RIHCRGRAHELRKQPQRYASPEWPLHGPHSQGRETRRPAGPASHQSRADHQPQDREGARPHYADCSACSRRRGDRMTRRLPPPWHADKFSGGYVVRDANGFAVAHVYGRSTEAEAIEAKQMTMDEARRVASNIAKLPDMLKRGE